MTSCIAEVIAAAAADPDPKIRAFWASIPCKGDVPTPEEAIAYISEMITKEL